MDSFKFAICEQFTSMRYCLTFRPQSKIQEQAMCQSLQDHRSGLKKETKDYHYANENKMIDRLVLGCTVREYKDKHGLPEKLSIVEILTPEKLEKLTELRQFNSEMLNNGIEYSE